jgi:hypothetical protein
LGTISESESVGEIIVMHSKAISGLARGGELVSTASIASRRDMALVSTGRDLKPLSEQRCSFADLLRVFYTVVFFTLAIHFNIED